MSKEKTMEEVREEFLKHVASMINYWDTKVEGTPRYKLEGLAHSILATLDGCSGGMPGFNVSPYLHEDDKQYNIDRDKDYYPESDCDIAGSLHEILPYYFKK